MLDAERLSSPDDRDRACARGETRIASYFAGTRRTPEAEPKVAQPEQPRAQQALPTLASRLLVVSAVRLVNSEAMR
jgi:hypothetical protein